MRRIGCGSGCRVAVGRAVKRISLCGDGLRQLLIADRWTARRSAGEAPGWPPATEPMRDRLLEALEADGPVEVDSATLMIALMHAKLEYRRFVFGGADWGKEFLLDEHDRLLELPA